MAVDILVDLYHISRVSALHGHVLITHSNSERKSMLLTDHFMKVLEPHTRSGHSAVLVTVDHASKWDMAVPIKNKTATTISNILKYQIIPNCVNSPNQYYD